LPRRRISERKKERGERSSARMEVGADGGDEKVTMNPGVYRVRYGGVEVILEDLTCTCESWGE
jgi:hypothetical protein